VGIACSKEGDGCSCEGGLEGRHVSGRRDVASAWMAGDCWIVGLSMNVLAEGVVCGKEGETGTCTAGYIHVGCENPEQLAFDLDNGYYVYYQNRQ